MITNRDEVLENALRVFAKLNYEKASQTEIAKACGLSKAGLLYCFPFKQDLYMAVVDKYLFEMQRPENKYRFSEIHSIPDFIDQYISGVERTMREMVRRLDDGNNPGNCSLNLYYFHMLIQVRLYYPDVDDKMKSFLVWNYRLWVKMIREAQERGEIRREPDAEQMALMFHHIFWGRLFEEAFYNELDTRKLREELGLLYSLVKA